MLQISNSNEKSISTQILELLKKNGIQEENIVDVLDGVSRDISNILWNTVPISLPLFYSLKDVVWYNLEHLPANGNQFGRSNLKWMGSKYPTFIFLDSLFVSKDKIKPLLNELEQIRHSWSNDWFFVQLKHKTGNWSGGTEDPSDVIIYDPSKEKPSRYGYNPYNPYSSIVDSKGNNINSHSEVVLCTVESKLGSYGYEPLMRNFLNNFIEECKKALKTNKGILLDINSYDYT